MNTNPYTYTVISCQSIRDLAAAMVFGDEEIILTDTGKMHLVVNRIEREDGSGTCFNVTANVLNINKDGVTFFVQTNGVGGEITTMTA
jgi:hypothetical protein